MRIADNFLNLFQGLFVGKEGPMIHSGAIIGAGIPQFQSVTFKKVKSKYDFFRTDRLVEKVDTKSNYSVLIIKNKALRLYNFFS